MDEGETIKTVMTLGFYSYSLQQQVAKHHSNRLARHNKNGYIPGSSETKTAARATAPVNREEKMSIRTPSHRPLASNTINDFVCIS